jgi:radical SAM superfamily enzyme YgiQ (UPF0313 family)
MNLFSEEKILTSFPHKKSDALELAICFPNTYMVGMASLGYQTAWKLLNQNENVKTTRWFTDIQEPRRGGACSALPPAYIGFSFSWELDYKNIFKILEENKISIFSSERSEDDPLVFAGGQIPNANPEPFCDNFDFFLTGDLEVVAEPFINKIVEIKDLNRTKKLEELAKVPGIYVPTRRGLLQQAPTTPIKINRVYAKENLSSSCILTPNSYWPDTFIIEVARSCPELCRFCLASYGSLPFRTPDIKNSLIPIIESGLKHTNKLGLLGASVTQHPGFDELLDYLLQKKITSPDLQVQIASVRADTISKKLAEGLHKLGSKSLTMAIETGSDRLREIINKKVSRETILNSIQTIYDSGFNSIKLYGMAGIPQETDDDLNETIKLLKEIKAKNKGKKLTWGCSTFVPKAQTPFQYYGMDKSAEKKLKLLSKELHKAGIEFKPESYEWSIIQGLISRGDRSINKILVDAYRYGSTIGSFKKAMRENKDIDSEYFIYKNWDINTKLPWENVQGFLNREIIKEHATL